MNLWGLMLRMAGWRVEVTLPPLDKCVICVAPHTSNYDFLIGLAAWHSLGRKASFLMKETWFFFPLSYLLRALGGIPVPRRKGSHLSAEIIARFRKASYMNLAVTPEGTRSARAEWRKGFLFIAYGAKVPVLLGVIDYKHKVVKVTDSFTPTGDPAADLRRVKAYYADAAPLARYPDKFKL